MDIEYLKYNYMKRDELKNICKINKIKRYSKLKKKDLIELIIKNLDKKICIKCEKKIEKNYIKYDNRYEHIECYNKEHNIRNKDIDCSICFEKITNEKEFITECNHCFHQDCIDKWEESGLSKNKCPNCRQKIKNPIKYNKIHTEIVRTTEDIVENNNINEENMLDFDNLYFQILYLNIMFLQKKNPEVEIDKIIEEFYNYTDSYLNHIISKIL